MLALPVWVSATVAVVAALAGVAYSRKLHEAGVELGARLRLKEAPLIPLSLIAFVGLFVLSNQVMSRPQLAWHLPLWLDYRVLAILWALRLLFVVFSFVSIVALAYRTRHRRRVLFLVSTILLTLAIEGALRYTHQPFLPELRHKEKDGVILQSHAATCGAASCANVARRLGVDMTENKMAKLLGTTWAGTSPAQMVYGLQSLGLDARKVNVPDGDLAEVTPPAVLLVEYGGEPDAHAVAYMGREGDRFEIWNPSGGRGIQDLEAVRNIWGGHAIEVRRKED